MGGFQGADTEALRQVGTDLGSRAQQIDDLATRLAALVETVPWTGPDADAFRADFSGHVRPDLLDCGTRIRRDAQEIEGHAEEQDRSSEEPGGASVAVGGALEFSAGAVEFSADAIQLVAGSAPDAFAPPPMMLAAAASEAVGSESTLEFSGSGLELEPPVASEAVTVGEDHDLHPGGVTKPFGLDEDGGALELEADTAYDVGDHGTFYTDADGEVTYVEAEGGGERMNPNLREIFPDATYHVNDNSFYRTDELGRTEHLYVPEVVLDRDNARSQSIQSEVNGHYDMTADGSTEELQFDAGHVLGRQFDGVREEINYTRQWSEVNQANGTDDSIYAIEDMMATGIEDGTDYSFETRIHYDDDHQPSDVGEDSPPYHWIPESYDVHVAEDGGSVVDQNLSNYPDGAQFAD